MLQLDSLESAIHRELGRIGSCSLAELNERLPYYSWNQVFGAVDRLTRMGIVTIQQQDSSDDILSLPPTHPFEKQDHLQA